MGHSTIKIINQYNLGNTMFFIIRGCLISKGVSFAVLGLLIIYEVEKSRQKAVTPNIPACEPLFLTTSPF